MQTRLSIAARPGALALLALALIGAAPTPDVTATQTDDNKALHYKIFRKGNSIGDHYVTLHQEKDLADISIEFSIRVKFLGITAFKMDHQANERWRLEPRTLEALNAVTDRSSGTFEVTVDVRDEGYEVGVNGAQSMAPEEIVPTSFTLASHLFQQVDREVILLDTLSGILRPSRIHYRRVEDTVAFANAIGTVHYYEIVRLDNDDVTHRIWFDETEAFLQVGLKTKDGHYVEYRRQA